jgi:lipopolysaccharide/colanic/teichoic acid biosynthesis glycosyltransferase
MLESAVSNQTTNVEDPGSRIGAYPDEGGLRRGGQVSVAAPSQAGERGVTRMARVTRQEWAPSILIFLFDIVTWMAIYGMATHLRNDAAFSGPFEFAVIGIIQIAVIVQALFIIGGYSPRTETRGLAYTAEHILALLCALGISAFVIYVAATYDHSMKPSRFAILSSFLVFIPASLFYRRWLRTHVTAATASRAFLVLGCGKMAADFYRAYYSSPNNQGLEFIDPEGGCVGERIAGPGSPLIEGDLSAKLDDMSRRYSGIILADQADRIRPDVLDRLIRTQFQRIRVYTLESFYEAHWRQVPAHSIDPLWPMQAGFQLSRTSPYHYVKRMCDVILSGLLLVICFPLMAALAGLIWLTSGRPIIFKQPRVGRDEAIFTAYKFRTMRDASDGGRETTRLQDNRTTDGEASAYAQGSGGTERAGGMEQGAEDGLPSRSLGEGWRSAAYAQGFGVPGRSEVREEDNEAEIRGQRSEVGEADLYTRENDPRILPVGRWLRKLRLDELPQLWNVFHGELSLIGPRAEWVECAERYRDKIPFYHFRHLVKPGITGWAQVNYPYGESEEDAMQKLTYDLYYIRHYSLKLDAMIVLKTIYTMFAGKGR